MLKLRNIITLGIALLGVLIITGRYIRISSPPAGISENRYETSIAIPIWCLESVQKISKSNHDINTTKVKIYPIDIFDIWDDQVRTLVIIGDRNSGVKERERVAAEIIKECKSDRADYAGDHRFDLLIEALRKTSEGEIVLLKFESDKIRTQTSPVIKGVSKESKGPVSERSPPIE